METPEEALQRQYRELCLEFAGGMAEKMAEIDAGLASLRTAKDALSPLADALRALVSNPGEPQI